MKLSLKKFQIDEYYIAYKIIRMRLCCDDIKRCMFIDISQDDDFEPQITVSQTTQQYIGDDIWLDEVDYTKITFCPFCGEKIIMSIDDVEDLSEYYKKLQTKELECRKKSRSVDSKKKEDEYLKQAEVLSEELNFYLTNDSIHNEGIF